jgi:hypothetical protein
MIWEEAQQLSCVSYDAHRGAYRKPPFLTSVFRTSIARAFPSFQCATAFDANYGDDEDEAGFAPLGVADGPIKRSSAATTPRSRHRSRMRLFNLRNDRFAAIKVEYKKGGPEPSNLRYRFVTPQGPIN